LQVIFPLVRRAAVLAYLTAMVETLSSSYPKATVIRLVGAGLVE
jgi:hypothetical protein